MQAKSRQPLSLAYDIELATDNRTVKHLHWALGIWPLGPFCPRECACDSEWFKLKSTLTFIVPSKATNPKAIQSRRAAVVENENRREVLFLLVNMHLHCELWTVTDRSALTFIVPSKTFSTHWRKENAIDKRSDEEGDDDEEEGEEAEAEEEEEGIRGSGYIRY